MTRALRVWFSGALEPAANMAWDEQLLVRAGPPLLRLYHWQPPGLSVGRFQDPAWFADVPGDHRVVRRVTGGGAIYHQHELTFALTCDAAVLPAGIGDSYDLVHGAIGQALDAVGVPTRLVAGNARAGCARSRQRWCFAEAGPHDLVTPHGSKIVGSAQRRLRRPAPRILHHGSIVLHAPAPTPCGAVADYVEPAQVSTELRQRVAAELARALGLELVRDAAPFAGIDPGDVAGESGADFDAAAIKN